MDPALIPYCGAASLPADWLGRWNFDPLLLIAMAGLGLAAYLGGRAKSRFWIGVAVLVLLFVSPLCALSSALFSVRVAHHVVLTAIAAPLLASVVVRGSASLWAGGHVLLFWFWHAPTAYAAALSGDGLFWLMQSSLLLSAIGFWSALARTPAPFAIGLLLGMMVQMGLLGALITFAGAPLYTPHYFTTTGWSLSPLEDQQLAGVIMWAPASAFYLVAALWRGWRLLGPPRVITA